MTSERLIGEGPDGRSVNNVTAENRFDVDESNPWIPVHLMSEDGSRLLKRVFIKNTRERPDVIMHKGQPFEVVTTRTPVAQYKQCMFLQAFETPGESNVENRNQTSE